MAPAETSMLVQAFAEGLPSSTSAAAAARLVAIIIIDGELDGSSSAWI